MRKALTIENIKQFLFQIEKGKSNLIHDATIRSEYKDEHDLDQGETDL